MNGVRWHGHGHVIPNEDGSKARCGGPRLCAVCALEYTRLALPPRGVAATIAGGTLEVGLTPDGREVVVNHPDLRPDAQGVGHIIFSARQASHFAQLLLEKAAQCLA